ncbi:hypothetical protein RRF57_013421 [Xylaria bambusicola]|uniref:Uncharacterized protein n=1 Tax=Xylaria bambusicola TaxID=326684 RepID=A0AAN7V1P7_9PEZI
MFGTRPCTQRIANSVLAPDALPSLILSSHPSHTIVAAIMPPKKTATAARGKKKTSAGAA